MSDHDKMILRMVKRDGEVYVSFPGLIAYVEERVRRREVLRQRMLEEDPPSVRDADPGPLLARELLESLKKGLEV